MPHIIIVAGPNGAGKSTFGDLRRLAAAVDAGENVMIETTLAVRGYANAIPRWQSLGYRVGLAFCGCPRQRSPSSGCVAA